MPELFLIYINHVGEDYKGDYLYEFIFSDTLVDIDGDGWDNVPASGRAFPPHKRFIKSVGLLTSDLKLDVIQDSDTFAVWDAVDDVISLSWENIDSYVSYPTKRLSFKFGEPIEKTIGNLMIVTGKRITILYNI